MLTRRGAIDAQTFPHPSPTAAPIGATRPRVVTVRRPRYARISADAYLDHRQRDWAPAQALEHVRFARSGAGGPRGAA